MIKNKKLTLALAIVISSAIVFVIWSRTREPTIKDMSIKELTELGPEDLENLTADELAYFNSMIPTILLYGAEQLNLERQREAENKERARAALTRHGKRSEGWHPLNEPPDDNRDVVIEFNTGGLARGSFNDLQLTWQERGEYSIFGSGIQPEVLEKAIQWRELRGSESQDLPSAFRIPANPNRPMNELPDKLRDVVIVFEGELLTKGWVGDEGEWLSGGTFLNDQITTGVIEEVLYWREKKSSERNHTFPDAPTSLFDLRVWLKARASGVEYDKHAVQRLKNKIKSRLREEQELRSDDSFVWHPLSEPPDTNRYVVYELGGQQPARGWYEKEGLFSDARWIAYTGAIGGRELSDEELINGGRWRELVHVRVSDDDVLEEQSRFPELKALLGEDTN